MVVIRKVKSIKTIKKLNGRRRYRVSVSSRSKFIPIRQLRADVVLRCLELAPFSQVHGGYLSTSQICSILGAPPKLVKPILKDLMDTHKLNGFHNQAQQFYRARQREMGDPNAP